MNSITSNQMELALVPSKRLSRVVTNPQRMRRANWWFAQMRQVVEQAVDWKEQMRSPQQPMLMAVE